MREDESWLWSETSENKKRNSAGAVGLPALAGRKAQWSSGGLGTVPPCVGERRMAKTDCVRRAVAAGDSCAASTSSPTVVKVTLAPRDANVVLGQEVRLAPPSTKDGVDGSPRKSKLKKPARETWAAQMGARSGKQDIDIAGDGNHHRGPVARTGRIYREGARNVVAGANPMDIKRGIDRAVESHHRPN